MFVSLICLSLSGTQLWGGKGGKATTDKRRKGKGKSGNTYSMKTAGRRQEQSAAVDRWNSRIISRRLSVGMERDRWSTSTRVRLWFSRNEQISDSGRVQSRNTRMEGEEEGIWWEIGRRRMWRVGAWGGLGARGGWERWWRSGGQGLGWRCRTGRWSREPIGVHVLSDFDAVAQGCLPFGDGGKVAPFGFWRHLVPSGSRRRRGGELKSMDTELESGMTKGTRRFQGRIQRCYLIIFEQIKCLESSRQTKVNATILQLKQNKKTLLWRSERSQRFLGHFDGKPIFFLFLFFRQNNTGKNWVVRFTTDIQKGNLAKNVAAIFFPHSVAAIFFPSNPVVLISLKILYTKMLMGSFLEVIGDPSLNIIMTSPVIFSNGICISTQHKKLINTNDYRNIKIFNYNKIIIKNDFLCFLLNIKRTVTVDRKIM
ncbi:putative signal peptide protein [Puccinia sorghi]|uniref:Putative signal peptide protein n=1 Tax=Puccinia sorghi TaxID=27349 RepID=A0A0L6UN87_9BASI|nr:putative signal peptide protein [Puccinia sorghi]